MDALLRERAYRCPECALLLAVLQADGTVRSRIRLRSGRHAAYVARGGTVEITCWDCGAESRIVPPGSLPVG